MPFLPIESSQNRSKSICNQTLLLKAKSRYKPNFSQMERSNNVNFLSIEDGVLRYVISAKNSKCTVIIITQNGESCVYIQKGSSSVPVLFESNLTFTTQSSIEDYLDTKSIQIIEMYSMPSKNSHAKWTPFYDGWFRYFYCSHCGYKSMERPQICPSCGTQTLTVAKPPLSV